MKSPFSDLFLAIQGRITANIRDIAYTDQDLGQLAAKGRPPVSWPCALIDFEDFRFEELAENVQTASGIVVIRMGFAPHSNTSSISPKDYREMALGYYELEVQLHSALQGWSPDGNYFGHMQRISAATQRRTDTYRVRELRYSIAFEDYSTKWGQQKAPATLVITETIALQ